MPKPSLLFLCLPLGLLTFASCGGGEEARAEAAFRSFWAALKRRDTGGMEPYVTKRSRPYLRFLPAPEGGRDPILLGIEREAGRIRLEVRDPGGEGGTGSGAFILRRERGLWKVDLIATAGEGAREVPRSGKGVRVVPAALPAWRLREAVRVFEASRR